MAVGVVIEYDSCSLEQYDRMLERMGYAPGGECAPGALFHWVTLTDNGIRATDVWHDRAACERFAEEQIGACAAEVGIPGPPKVSVYEVHNYLTVG